MKLLLFSNSTNPGQGFLEHGNEEIKKFLGKKPGRILFIPYAAVTLSYDVYFDKVKEKFRSLGYLIDSIHQTEDPGKAVKESDCIVVGGGNTFHLLQQIQKNNLTKPIANRIKSGALYIGWSAGINLACPTIRTTNDMPIIETENLKGFNLIPFQINPHYTDKQIEGHGGESREMRIEEFLKLNQQKYVIGLREGSALKIESEKITLLGKNSARLFKYGNPPSELTGKDDLNFLLL